MLSFHNIKNIKILNLIKISSKKKGLTNASPFFLDKRKAYSTTNFLANLPPLASIETI